MQRLFWIKTALLLSSMMTMMAGAIMAPTLPRIHEVFIELEWVDILSKLVLTLPALFIVFCSPIAGIIVDKFGRKIVLIISLLIYATAGMSGYFLNNLYLILVGRAFLGIGVAGLMTSIITIITDYFNEDERNAFMGLQGAFMGIGGVIFIAFAGFLADLDWQYPFLIYGFSLPVLLVVIYSIYEPDRYKHHDEQSTEMDEPLSPERIKSITTLIYIIAFFGIVFFTMMPVQVPYILSKIEGVNSTLTGVALSTMTLSTALVSANYKRFKKIFTYPGMYSLGFLILGIGFLFIASATTFKSVLFGLIISGFGGGIMMPNGNLWLMSIAPPERRGRLIGNMTMALFLGQFFSPILVQPIVKYGSLALAFTVCAIIMIASVVPIFIYAKRKG